MPLLPQAIVEYGDRLSWNLLARESYVAEVITPSPFFFRPISQKSFITESNIIQVGVGCVNAKPRWWLGAHIGIEIDASPSSTSEFSSWVQVSVTPCQLGKLTLIETQKRNTNQYRINVRFPSWLPDAYLEIWYYDLTSEQQDINEVKLNSIIEHFNI